MIDPLLMLLLLRVLTLELTVPAPRRPALPYGELDNDAALTVDLKGARRPFRFRKAAAPPPRQVAPVVTPICKSGRHT